MGAHGQETQTRRAVRQTTAGRRTHKEDEDKKEPVTAVQKQLIAEHRGLSVGISRRHCLKTTIVYSTSDYNVTTWTNDNNLLYLAVMIIYNSPKKIQSWKYQE